MRWLLPLLFPALLVAQTPDSVTRDSVAVWSVNTRAWYTVWRTDTLIDTLNPTPLPSGPGLAGIPNGPTALPLDSLCAGLGYSATALTIIPAKVVSDLATVKRCGGKVNLALPRRVMRRAHSEGARTAIQWIRDSIPGVNPYFVDGTVFGFYVGDDVAAPSEWGTKPMSAKMAVWDSIGIGGVERWGTKLPILLRARPRQMTARVGGWKWVTTGWAQYTAYPAMQQGPPAEFYKAEVASAKAQKLGVVLGLNLLNGGALTSTGQCVSGIPGEDAGKCAVSAQEYLAVKTLAIAEPYACASLDWQWSLYSNHPLHSRPDIQLAAKMVAGLAVNRASVSCIQR